MKERESDIVRAICDYLSPEQKEFSRGLVENGGEYHVVRSIDDVRTLGL